jgi:hypothetical protein
MMRITPRTMTAVPRISVAVTAVASVTPESGYVNLRVPTSHLAKMKLKIKAVDPSGATQSGRRYFNAKGEPTVISAKNVMSDLHACDALLVSFAITLQIR